MNKSVKKNKKNKVKGSVKKRHTKKNSIKKTLKKKYTKKNKRKIGGEGKEKEKETKLAILLITTHGNLDNLQPLKKHEEDINVYKINATKPGVCNYIEDSELKTMGLELSKFINDKIKDLKEEKLEDFTKEISEMLPEIDEVHKDAKKISKLAPGKKSNVEPGFIDPNDSDEDAQQYIKHSNEENTYQISQWKKDDEYHDKAYTIILDERMETNENPYNNTIIFLGEEGLPALEYVEMAYNLRNTKEKAIEEEEEKEEKEENVFNLDELLSEIENIKKSDENDKSEESDENDKSEESDENDKSEKSEKSDEKSDKSEESEEEYDTNKYISLSEILKNLKEKGYTDTIIIDLSCSVGYDPRSSRTLRRTYNKDNYGGK
jgi:hypothetical protein